MSRALRAFIVASRRGKSSQTCYLLAAWESIIGPQEVPAWLAPGLTCGSLGGDAERILLIELGEAAREGLAFGVEQGRRPCARDRVDALPQWDAARQDRSDDPVLDQPVVGGAMFVGVTVALDQSRAFRDLEREVDRQSCSLDDET